MGVAGLLLSLLSELFLQVFNLIEHALDGVFHLLHILLLILESLLQLVVDLDHSLQLAEQVVVFLDADLSLVGLNVFPLSHFDCFAELPFILLP